MSLPPVNLAIVQPAGYVHSLGLVDPARYVRHQFRRLGAAVTISKNAIREDAVNFVFGAHLGMPADWSRRAACVIVNLEQLGHGGAAVDPDYLRLLSRSAVVDYDASNVAAYGQDPADVPLLPFGHAPYLDEGASPPIEERPIDLLFFGSTNPRRRAFIERVEATGLRVSMFDQPLYGPERDLFVRQAKAVLNCHFYETSRFERVRAFHCLSLGTPVIAERGASTRAEPAFEDAVFWIDDAGLERFFAETFRSPSFGQQARARLAAFRRHDPIEAYADALAFAVGYAQAAHTLRPEGPWRPGRLQYGPGAVPGEGWMTVDDRPGRGAELVLDLAAPIDWSRPLHTEGGAAVRIEPGAIEIVHARTVPDAAPALEAWMDNVMMLLRDDGQLVVDAPLRPAPSAGVPAAVGDGPDQRAWSPWIEGFWARGWLEHRFEWLGAQWLDAAGQACPADRAAVARTALRKVETSASERMLARTMRADFGGIDEDDGSATEQAPQAASPQLEAAVPAEPVARTAAPIASTVQAAPLSTAFVIRPPDRGPDATPADPALPRYLERLSRAR
jgi:hypothetical protein